MVVRPGPLFLRFPGCFDLSDRSVAFARCRAKAELPPAEVETLARRLAPSWWARRLARSGNGRRAALAIVWDGP